ncbi:hypothetical protein [Bacterioplanoides sp.]|uniref:hypothetical protein n=1 Tax=Bacterioplanoides sp. TaxID=2066072 RepID=UPI003B59EC6C
MTVRKALFLLLTMTFASVTSAADLKGVGLFETLDKPWFATALYTQDRYERLDLSGEQADSEDTAETPALPMRLEFKVVEASISQRRFRQLWIDALSAVDHDSLQGHQDFTRFLGAVKGSLQQHDYLVLKQEKDHVSLSINYHEHARLSADFLNTLVTVLTAKISPVPALKHGLLGKLPKDTLRGIQRTFDHGEPTLHRISQTARWLRLPQQQSTTLASNAS